MFCSRSVRPSISTDAGNIGPVMDALRADAQADMVVVRPAFPEAGRTVYQGTLFVGDVPLNESPLKDHPAQPDDRRQPGACVELVKAQRRWGSSTCNGMMNGLDAVPRPASMAR